MRYKANRGGHAPGHLREALEVYLEIEDEEAMKEIFYEPEGKTLEWLLGQLWNCTDVMPYSLCDLLDLSQGSSYAQGVRRAKEEL